MSRPASMKVDGTVYWTLTTYDSDGVLVDADSTPTVAVRKNGASVGDAVTVTKRSATTGIYDCSHAPSGEAEGDCFIYEESATISTVVYLNPWSLEVLAAERGTDLALLSADIILTSGEVTTSNPAAGGGSAHTAADVANLILVTPANKLATDASGNVEANNMRGTDSANTIAPVDVSSSVADILADTADLQANQGNWLTATTTVSSNMRGTDGANTVVPNTVAPDNASIAAILVDTADLQANQGQWLTATGFNTVVPVDVSVDVAAILADTNELQGNQGDWATATTVVASNMRGTDNASTFDHTSDAVITDTASRDASKANVSGLSTFDPSSDEVVTDAASRAASKADVSGLSTFDSSTDQVVASNMRGTDGANTVTPNTVAPVDVSADVALILADTADLQANQGQWLTATTTVSSNMRGTDGANTVAPVDVSSDVSAIKSKTDQFVFTVSGQVDANALTGGGGGSAPTAQEIVDAWGNQPQGTYVTSGTLGYYLDAQVSTAGSGGAGLYQATVRVQDGSSNALQGARVNIDGTTLTLTTDSAGEVTFNLDSGVYLLEVSPPAGYDTPTGQVLTVSTSDPSTTAFTLDSTSDPSGCDIPWIG